MNTNTEEAEGLQPLGTFANDGEGSRVTKEQNNEKSPWMVGLREGVIDFSNAFQVYVNRMNTEDRLSRTCFAISLTTLALRSKISVDKYLDALEKGECVSVLDNYFWKRVSELPELEGSKVESTLLCEIIPLKEFNLEITLGDRKLNDTKDIYLLLKEIMADLTIKLKKALMKLSEVNSKFYEDLYEKEKALFNFNRVENEFYNLGLKKASSCYEDLDVFRTKKVLLFLMGGGLSLNDDPSAQDLALVQEEEVKKRMPHNFKYPDDFRDLCARIIPYRYWQGSEFHLKKAELGCYLHQFYYQMTIADRRAIFDLEVMMELVNEKMRKDFPEKTMAKEKKEEIHDLKPIDLRVKKTVEMMQSENIIVHLYDYTWIYEVMNQTEDLPSFDSPQSFLTYFAGLGISPLPDQSSIIKELGKMLGTFPHWTFLKKDKTESDRRTNVGKRFLNIYRSLVLGGVNS